VCAGKRSLDFSVNAEFGVGDMDDIIRIGRKLPIVIYHPSVLTEGTWPMTSMAKA
jgi:hypothetical protein